MIAFDAFKYFVSLVCKKLWHMKEVSGSTLMPASPQKAILAGDRTLTASPYFDVIGSGYCNLSCAGTCYTFIGNGCCNTVAFAGASIIGGRCNTASGYGAFIGNGGYNIASGEASAVVDGACNCVLGDFSFIGGGGCNAIFGTSFNSITGGFCNTNSGVYSAILGGACNTISAAYQYAGIFGCNVTAATSCALHANGFLAQDLLPLSVGNPPGLLQWVYAPASLLLPPLAKLIVTF